MNKHITLCFYNDPPDGSYTDICICDRLQAERERIAQEIEALPWDMRTMKQQYRGMLTLVRASAYTRCARIARGEE